MVLFAQSDLPCGTKTYASVAQNLWFRRVKPMVPVPKTYAFGGRNGVFRD